MKRRKVLHLPGMLCACFMLCLLPLLYRNAFFDINRFKVEAVRIVVPVIGMVSAAAWLLVSRNRKIHTTIRNTDICVLLFALTCFISSARTGFDSASLIGNEGRYCGLWVMLSCALAYWLISRNKIGLRLIGMLTVISAQYVYHLLYSRSGAFKPVLTDMLRIPKWWTGIAVPIGFGISTYHSVIFLLRDKLQLFKSKTKEGGEEA